MKKYLSISLFASALALVACGATGTDSSDLNNSRMAGNSVNEAPSSSKRLFKGNAKTEDRIRSIAKQAVKDGNTEEALLFYEGLYKRDSNNVDNALSYAQVLRKTGHPQRSVMVLSRFVDRTNYAEFATADDKKRKSKKLKQYDRMLILEYASALLEMGQFERSERFLQPMLEDKKASDLHPQVHNLIGVSMDARAMHGKAEMHYRAAMDGWEGTPINVMNNLALNLAHQGYFDESLDLLRRARVMAPDQESVAANIDIVTDLQKAIVAKPTKLQ